MSLHQLRYSKAVVYDVCSKACSFSSRRSCAPGSRSSLRCSCRCNHGIRSVLLSVLNIKYVMTQEQCVLITSGAGNE